MSADPSPEYLDWLARERQWGRRALEMLAELRASAPRGEHGIDRFALRMSAVRLTGSVAGWSHNLCAGLAREGFEAGGDPEPPFLPSDGSAGALEPLERFINAKLGLIESALGNAAGG